ncbi:MAG: metalloregulator ArsR/SmtB family transcription factor [Candidatus Muiribacteriota bacterium]
MLNEHVRLFKGLSEPLRLRIINLLFEEKNLCVCSIVDSLEETRSKISRHLIYMVNSGILKSFKKEQWSYYYLSEEMKRNDVILYVYNQIRNQGICIKDSKRLKEFGECR